MASRALRVVGSYRDDPLTQVEERTRALEITFHLEDHHRASGVEKVFVALTGSPVAIATLIGELRSAGLEVS